MTSQVITKVVDGVGVLSLNRPHRHNAVSDEMFDEMGDALRAHLKDNSVRCILLRGEGSSFCSGRDTAQLGRRVNGEDDFSFVARHQRFRFDLLESPKPVVAAVKGYALGGGFELALSADIRIVADDAVFSLPEVGYGLVTDTGGAPLLAALAGPARAKYLVLSGVRIDAATAHHWGIAEEVVSPESLDDRAMEFCRRLAAQPGLAVSMGKMLIDQATSAGIRNGIRQELIAQTALFSSHDYLELKRARQR